METPIVVNKNYQTSPGLRVCAGIGRVARMLPQFSGKSLLGRKMAAAILGGKRRTVVPVRLRGGTRLLLDPRGRTESGAFYNGRLDEDDLDFFRCCTEAESVALDIGANIGLVSIPLGRHLKTLNGRLFCVEPVATNAERLRANVGLNELDGMATVIECALSDTEGTMEIGRESGNGAETGNAVLKPGGANWDVPLEWTTTTVRRLDAVAAEYKIERLDFVKIDTEGAELGVLRGGASVIGRLRPIIYGEFNAGLMPRFKSSFADVGALMAPMGYRAMAFAHRLALVDVPFEAGRGNAVLFPSEKADWLLRRCAAARNLSGR